MQAPDAHLYRLLLLLQLIRHAEAAASEWRSCLRGVYDDKAAGMRSIASKCIVQRAGLCFAARHTLQILT